MPVRTQLTSDQRSVLMSEGSFHGISSLLAQKKISPEDAGAVLSQTYDALLIEIREAKREMQHIAAVLDRLEHTCEQGRHSRHAVAGDSNHVHLNQNLIAFDGWVVSLMETDLTMTGLLNPKFTRTKITEFGKAMNDLMDKRSAAQHPLLDSKGAFDGYLNNY